MATDPPSLRFRWALFAMVPLAACQGSETARDVPSLVPNSLHGLALVERRSGSDAASLIQRLHDRSVAPVKSEIGSYDSGEMQAVVYVSRFESAEDAGTALIDMAEGIGTGSSGFGHHESVTIAGVEVHRVVGHGQLHYFFARATDVTWLSVPPSLARPALAQLLNVDVDTLSPDEGTAG